MLLAIRFGFLVFFQTRGGRSTSTNWPPMPNMAFDERKENGRGVSIKTAGHVTEREFIQIMKGAVEYAKLCCLEITGISNYHHPFIAQR